MILSKWPMYSFCMCGLRCQMGVVFMFLCEYYGMPKEGGVVCVYRARKGGVIVGLC